MITTRLSDCIFLNLEDVSRCHWRSKGSQKVVKITKNVFSLPGIGQKIILHPNDDTYECNFVHDYSFNI